MNLDVEAFAQGAWDRLEEKQAGANLLDALMNENILPTFAGQRKWQYAQAPEGLRLSDGERVYSFGLSDLGGEVGRVPKLDDIPLRDFEQGTGGVGTAQIHRSSPDSIYLTLANGRENPTFRLEHEEGKNWKYIPSKKMLARLNQLKTHEGNPPSEVGNPRVDAESFLQGGIDGVKTAGVGNFLFGDGLKTVGDPTRRGLATDMALYSNPVTGVATSLWDTGSHLMKGNWGQAAGALGMGALSFLPGAGSAVRGVLGAGKSLGGAALRTGSKVVGQEAAQLGGQAVGAAGKSIASLGEQAVAKSPGLANGVQVAKNIGEGTRNFARGGREAVTGMNNAASKKIQSVIPQKYDRIQGFQNPLKGPNGGVGLRSPIAPDFNVKNTLRSGVDAMARNPLEQAQWLHSYGVGGEAPQPVRPGYLSKSSSVDGIFGGATGAAEAINGGLASAKNILAAIGNNPALTMGGAVALGMGANRLRERLDPEHQEEMRMNPGGRLTRELTLPLLGGLGLAALGGRFR